MQASPRLTIRNPDSSRSGNLQKSVELEYMNRVIEGKHGDIQISLSARLSTVHSSQYEQVIPHTGDQHRGPCGKGLTINRVFGVYMAQIRTRS